MIQTSNFAVAKNDQRAVAICQGVPWWYKGRRMLELAPTRAMLDDVKATGDTKRFDEAMRQILEGLDAAEIVKALGPDAILLCWESAGVRCHRRLVADWIQRRLGIFVPELGHETEEHLPYELLPPKKSKHVGKNAKKVSKAAVRTATHFSAS